MTELKIPWYIAIVFVFEYLDIKEAQVSILSILMIIDTITWVAKQYKLNKNEITSHNAWKWITKKMLTMMFLFSFALMFKWIDIDWTAYIKSVLSLLIVSEFYSICQNVYSFRTGKKVNEYDAVSLIIKFIWESLVKVIEWKIWKQK